MMLQEHKLNQNSELNSTCNDSCKSLSLWRSRVTRKSLLVMASMFLSDQVNSVWSFSKLLYVVTAPEEHTIR
jgi:hypothetical protein